MTDIHGMHYFTRNAYRTLGMLGHASGAAIRNAAEVMEASLKMGVSRTSAWDLPWLGGLERNASDMRDAVERLGDPSTRLRERMFWFHEGEVLLKGLTLDSLDEVADKWAQAGRPSSRHDAALLRLLAALIVDSEYEDEDRWMKMIGDWKQLVERNEYWDHLVETERSDGFANPAALADVDKLRKGALELLVDCMSGPVVQAMARREYAVGQRALLILRKARLSSVAVQKAEQEILGPLEDIFYALCSEIRRKCDDNVRRDGRYVEENRAACSAAMTRLETEVEPTLAMILDLGGNDSPSARRARERTTFCLHGLALNHVWAEEYAVCERLLARAKELAPPDSLIMSRIEEAISSLAVQAKAKMAKYEEMSAAGMLPPRQSRGWQFALATAVVAALAMGIYLNMDHNGTEMSEPLTMTKDAGHPPVSEVKEEDAVSQQIREKSETPPPSAASRLGIENRARSMEKKPPVAAKPDVRPEVKKERPAPSRQVTASVAPPTYNKKAVTRPLKERPARMKSAARRAPSQTVAAVSVAAGAPKDMIIALEQQIATNQIVIGRLEGDLREAVQDIEAIKARIEKFVAQIDVYERQLKDGANTDTDGYKRLVYDNNMLIRHHNVRLADARRMAAEHDSMLRENLRLAEQYQMLAAR